MEISGQEEGHVKMRLFFDTEELEFPCHYGDFYEILACSAVSCSNLATCCLRLSYSIAQVNFLESLLMEMKELLQKILPFQVGKMFSVKYC